MEGKSSAESRITKTSNVFPNDLNNNNTLFGGKLMSYIDDVASLSAIRHARSSVVTASMDSVDFLLPIRQEDSVCLEGVVTWTGKTSMEVFVKVVAENLYTGDRRIAATSFSTFVALDENGRPKTVPPVLPENDEEKSLYNTAPDRAKTRREKRRQSQELAGKLTTKKRWE
ncbi:acyl-CoA thioesterase [Alicyclobacillus sp. SO9]|uniref:acyl-CoA thioesterase n=1 Tax=Alicyclobacillus sp. SO9 TaxID=2665646 RepID=UPI0018E85126|nr:acyl-CoA thioesterase [Alicyclobacillus sp. SO9]QQE78122.1 acyl-CoA thioesterase [Alicyclobacillus sp. SO9]